MTVRVVCRGCGKRLKLPDGATQRRAAKCPKCLAPVDLTAALAASVYLPAMRNGTTDAKPKGAKEADAKGKEAKDAKETKGAKDTRDAKGKESGSSRPPLTQEIPLSLDDEAPLSLDDDPAPAAPPGPEPFRVPVAVLADSARQVVGPCFAVFVPHGLFLELEPLKPFLYVPVGSAADSPATGELAVTLPDGRAVTLRVEARYAAPLAADARAFLTGERPAPVAADYRRRPPLWPAVAACAAAALFLLVATAHEIGRKKGIAEAEANAPPVQIVAVPAPPPVAPALVEPPAPRKPLSHVERAYANGASALDDGPADVSALALAPDANHLGIGYADGTTRVWPLDQPTFEPGIPGPKAAGAVTRVQFDSSSRFLFATTAGEVIAAPRNGPPASPAKLTGTLVAVAPEVTNDRVRFAAVRGNVVAHRLLPTAFVVSPPKGKDFAVPTVKDELVPAGNGPDPAKPTGPTFLAWTLGNRLLAGATDGAVTAWSVQMKPEPVHRAHKAAVRVWAASHATGDFATGDDKGTVAIWPKAGGKPTAGAVFTVPVVALAFSPSGKWLAAADNTGWLVLVEAATLKVTQRKKLPAPAKTLAFGPKDDALILGNGKAVEVWKLAELFK